MSGHRAAGTRSPSQSYRWSEFKRAQVVRGRNADMCAACVGDYPTLRGASDEAQSHQVRFVDVLNGSLFFGDGSGERLQSDCLPAEGVRQRQEDATVGFFEALVVYLQHLQRPRRRFHVDCRDTVDLGEVADTLQETVRDARSRTCGAGDDG